MVPGKRSHEQSERDNDPLSPVLFPSSKKLCSRLSLDDFLTTDGPTGITVGPDGTRAEFFLHLGLSERNNRHRIIYRRMKQEARAGMERLFETRDSLQPDLVDDDTVLPPYSTAQMTECAFQREVEKIYETASSQTKGIYDIIQTQNGVNWVIRWILWRVVTKAQHFERRAASSGGETEYSTLTTCSTAADYSIPSVCTDRTSPVAWTNPVSPHDLSDSENWDADIKIKVEAQTVFKKPPLPRVSSKFWDHVMDDNS